MMYDNRDRVKTAKQICSKRSVSPVKILCHMGFDVRFSYCFLIMKYLNVFLILTLFNFKVRRRSNNFVKLGRLLRLKIHWVKSLAINCRYFEFKFVYFQFWISKLTDAIIYVFVVLVFVFSWWIFLSQCWGG